MLRFVCLLTVTLAGCGIVEPNVVDCGDDCPGVQGGQGGGGSGGGGLDGSSGEDASSGSGGGAGSGGSGGTGGLGGTGGSLTGGDGGGGVGPDGGCAGCGGDKPYCHEDECAECSMDGHCAAGVCLLGACADCRISDDCKDVAASRCTDASECVACEVNADCSHLDQRVCDDGVCVECTAEDRSHCGMSGAGESYVCDVLEKRCSTSATRRSAGLCEACVSDEQCGAEQLCVLQRFEVAPDEEEDVGYFCFYREDAAQPNGSCANVPPFFSTLLASTSISGAQATVCGLRVTTCSAYRDYSSTPCGGLGDDASCGDSRFNDGYCREAATDTFRCTTPCLSTDDCKAGAACTSTVPSFCSLQ